MKIVALGLLLLNTLSAAAQATWPHNPKNDSIEFRGIIPWPRTDTTTTQRRILVQQWYAVRLLAKPPNKPISWATKYDEAPLERISLAGHGHFTYSDKVNYVLTCDALLSPTAAGMAYRLSHFVWWRGRGKLFENLPLEALRELTGADRESIQVFRARIEAALADW